MGRTLASRYPTVSVPRLEGFVFNLTFSSWRVVPERIPRSFLQRLRKPDGSFCHDFQIRHSSISPNSFQFWLSAYLTSGTPPDLEERSPDFENKAFGTIKQCGTGHCRISATPVGIVAMTTSGADFVGVKVIRHASVQVVCP